MKTLKDLHNKHFQQNVKIIFNNPLTNRDFVKNVLHTQLCLTFIQKNIYIYLFHYQIKTFM